jgi:hypothetical protein
VAEPIVITWSPANWITVVLMVALAFFIVGAVSKAIQQRTAA